MINIRDITTQIRGAEYGLDVRENIALGIEQISDREDSFELIINNSETTRVNNENTRKSSETARVSAETTRGVNETARVSAEITRGTNEAARVLSEATRVSEWNVWKNSNTMLNDLYIRQAILIPTKTALTVTRAGLAFNPLTSFSVTSLTSVANNTMVDNGLTKDNLCYFARNQVRGGDSIIFKTINEFTLNGAEVR